MNGNDGSRGMVRHVHQLWMPPKINTIRFDDMDLEAQKTNVEEYAKCAFQCNSNS